MVVCDGIVDGVVMVLLWLREWSWSEVGGEVRQQRKQRAAKARRRRA